MSTKLATETVAGRDAGHAVALYGLSFCDHCHEGKAFLESAGIEFEFAFIDLQPAPIRAQATARFRRVYGESLIYPILEVDGELIFGFDESEWRSRLGLEPPKT
jgi:glutaredoxin